MLIASHISSDRPLNWGADWGPWSLHFQWWCPLTSTFIQVKIAHLADNMLLLWILGRRMERVLGKWKFLALYLITGIAGSLATLAVIPEKVSYGASGNVYGLLGALLITWRLGKLPLSRRGQWWLGIVALLLLYSLYSGSTNPGIANSAHLAGFISGVILGEMMLSARARNPRFLAWVYSGAGAVLLLSLISLQYRSGYLAPLASVDQEMEEKHYAAALAHINMVLQHNPDSVLANSEAAQCYFEQKDYVKAEAAAKRSLASDPDSFSATLILASVYARTGRMDKARSLAVKLFREERHEEAAMVFATIATIERKSTQTRP